MPRGEKSLNRSKEMAGQKFNRLTVLSRAFNHNRSRKGDSSARWLCKCECGSESTVSRRSLLSNEIQSCGCLRIDMNRLQAKARRSAGITAPLKRMIRAYKWNAKKRKLSFLLEEEEFFNLIKQPCYYCGIGPIQVLKTIRNFDKEHILLYNGIDRLNNNFGYIKVNVVACCGICNKMKMSLTKEVFLTKIKAIYLNNMDRKL